MERGVFVEASPGHFRKLAFGALLIALAR